MGVRLADGGSAHEPVDLVPRSRPVHAGRDLPRGVVAGAHRVDDLDEPVLVVGADLEQPGAVADVAPLVRGQRLDGVELCQPLQRAEVVAQRIGLGLRVEVHVRRDPREHAVAGEHEAVGRLPEAEVAGRVAGRPQRGEVPPGHVGLVAVLHQHVGLDDVDERAAPASRRCAAPRARSAGAPSLRSIAAHALEQVGGLLVAVVDERGVGRVQRDPGVGDLRTRPARP